MAMRRARRDEANREFFDHFSPATLRDFLPQLTIVATLIAIGGLLWRSDNSGWIAACALLGTLVGIAYEGRRAAQYWRLSMGTA